MSLVIASPLAGWIVPLDQVPDPVFSGRMLGEGLAVDPTEGKLVAPAAGRIATLNPSRHAVTIDLDDGAQLLIHIGIDTVALGGEGFVAHVAEGQRVAAGDLTARGFSPAVVDTRWPAAPPGALTGSVV